MRRLSWERTFTISLALAIALCAGLVAPARPPLNWTDTSNENGFRVEHSTARLKVHDNGLRESTIV
jgi:hypothetical protein